MTHLRITIDVSYDDATVLPDDVLQLKRLLERGVTSAIERGLLTPSGEEIVEDWDVEAEER